MDQFIQAGESFLSNQGGNNQQQGGQQGGGGFDIGSIESLVGHANDHDQSGSGNQQMFSQAASFLKSSQGSVDGNVDDDQLMQTHQKVNNSNEPVQSSEIGNAAALSAIKSVLGGGGGSGGGDIKSKLIGAAMAHSSALFDQKAAAGVAQGDKQDAMQSAGQTVMNLLLKYETGGLIGGGPSSGLSSLMKLAM